LWEETRHAENLFCLDVDFALAFFFFLFLSFLFLFDGRGEKNCVIRFHSLYSLLRVCSLVSVVYFFPPFFSSSLCVADVVVSRFCYVYLLRV